MKNPLSSLSVTVGHVKVIVAGAVALVLGTLGVTHFFVEQSDFTAYAETVAAQSAAQQAVNIRATIMLEIRFLQAQRRIAKAAGNQAEADRLTDEIDGLKLELEALK